MRRQHIPLYAIAVGLLVIGALAAGVPASTLLLLAVVLTCPAMMLFMHGGHGGQAAGEEHSGHRRDDHGIAAGGTDNSRKSVDAAATGEDVGPLRAVSRHADGMALAVSLKETAETTR